MRRRWVNNIDEAQHAKADSVLIEEIAGQLSLANRERSNDALLDLGETFDTLFARQVEMDLDALEKLTGRALAEDDKAEIRTHQRRSYRWTFLSSGLNHPKFVEIVHDLTNEGGDKIAKAAEALAA